MNRIVTASCIGTFGHWGNSLFQYAFARAYAEMIGADLFIPREWAGRRIFEGIYEPFMSEHLPTFEKTESPAMRDRIDLHGYFQRPEHLAILSRKKLKQWFKPKPEFEGVSYGVAFHKRRGDYIQAGNYALIEDKSYERAARNFGYNPLHAKVFSDEKGLGNEDQHSDFFSLSSSKVIFRANSSFSWWAATLSDAKVFSPVVGDKTGWVDVDFVEGNHPKMVGNFEDLHLPE